MTHRWWPGISMAAGVFLLNAILNAPLFEAGDLPYRDSIEAGYAAMARFVATHPNPWGWNPLQYCGLPTQFMYLPGLPYLAAAAIWALPNLEPYHVYRIVTVVLACLGPVTLFVLVSYFTRDRWWALAASLAYTFFSPLYGLVLQISNDRGITQAPWRLQVLIKYGEGPHTAGLTLLPLAIVALWAAATGTRYWKIFVAAAALAAVALTNWVAALALAFCGFTMLLAAAGTYRATGFRVTRVLAAAVLAYLLAGFWLTPTFVRTIAFNWPTDAFRYRLRTDQILLIVGLLAGMLVLRLAFAWWSGATYPCFLAVTVFGFGYIVLAYYWYGKDTIPESRRYALELELFLFLALFELFRWRYRSGQGLVRLGVILIAVALFWFGKDQARLYVTQFHQRMKPIPMERTVEYRVARRLAEEDIQGRTFLSGGLRFRANSWFAIPQVGGTFESGLRNRIPVHFAYQIRTSIGSPPGRDGHDALLQLKAMGVQYVVVHGPESKEYYRDFKNPWKFEGLLESIYRESDDVIYRLPLTSLAHLVRPEELPEAEPIGGYLEYLQPYVGAIDDASRPKLVMRQPDPDTIHIAGPVPDGMVISVQMTHDRGWFARQDGREIPIEADKLGFMVLRPSAAASSDIEMKYRGTQEQRMMGGISALAWLGSVGGLWIRRRVA